MILKPILNMGTQYPLWLFWNEWKYCWWIIFALQIFPIDWKGRKMCGAKRTKTRSFDSRKKQVFHPHRESHFLSRTNLHFFPAKQKTTIRHKLDSPITLFMVLVFPVLWFHVTFSQENIGGVLKGRIDVLLQKQDPSSLGET